MSNPKQCAPQAGSQPASGVRKSSSTSRNQNDMSEQAQDIRISPYYHEAKNEITQPGHFVACSRYFVQRWVPRLGSVGTAMVLYLRSLGYYNPLTGERRDGIQVSLKQIAGVCGCSDRTIQRELDRNEALQSFVKVEACYECKRDGRPQRQENIYRIAMDDPLAPEDQDRLVQILADRAACKAQTAISAYPAAAAQAAAPSSCGNASESRGNTSSAPLTTFPGGVSILSKPLTPREELEARLAVMRGHAPPVHKAAVEAVARPDATRSTATARIFLHTDETPPVAVGTPDQSEPSRSLPPNEPAQRLEADAPRRQIDATPIPMDDNLPIGDNGTPPDTVSLPSRPIVATLASHCQGKECGDKLASQSSLPEIHSEIHNTSTSAPVEPGSGGSSVSAGRDMLVVALCACGVTAKAAQKLVAEHPHDLIRKQIAALPYREPQNPGATLASSIREDWALPTVYQAAEKERLEKKLQEERRAELRLQHQQEVQQRGVLEGRLQAYWDALSLSEQEAVSEAALESVKEKNKFLVMRFERDGIGGALQQMVAAQRERILAERLGILGGA